MDEERYPDPMSILQHIDEGETRYQQEEESYEVNEEQTEAIVSEEDHGELIENFNINENTKKKCMEKVMSNSWNFRMSQRKKQMRFI